MFLNNKLVILKNVTSLVNGDAIGTSFAQVPLSREIQLELPIINGTSLKGAMKKNKLININVSITDMKILLFPIGTQEGVHYITCPFILRRLVEEIEKSHLNVQSSIDGIWHFMNLCDDEVITFNEYKDYKLVIDGFLFKARKSRNEKGIQKFMSFLGLGKVPFSILNDEVFCFLINKHTGISVRNKINEENTLVFDEEQFPSSTLFYFWCLGQYSINVKKNNFQLGGNRSLGKGIMKIKNIL